ncbi:NhaP-type Na+/H+ and K+/H+ antiporter [Pontibacter aydingkolensis]|uniref:Uncharacterized protein n=1 Tax=Pontibacter aydingkolensis TaxID=1911536 RepID=A0ABS7CS45_9BACT|nr:hypothetical protein [Pontibacter aydingkolensis]MBW7466655.1 hypothetical protein [Pontibacter aydingkolensis]
MNKSLHVVLLFFLFSCNGTEERAHVKEKEHQIKHFEEFVFSIEPGWSTDDSKDVEIHKDGTTYLRLRDNREIKENYKAKLDSQSLRQIFLLVDSMNVEALDTFYQEYEDGAYYSMRLKNNGKEVRTKGMDFPIEVQKMLMELVEIVEGQQLVKTFNRRFATTKDVLWPLPPGYVESQAVLDSL